MSDELFRLDRLPELIKKVQRGVVQIDFQGSARYGNGSGFLIEPLPADTAGSVVHDWEWCAWPGTG